jgi:adenosylcobinamide amidohydrolase
MDQDRLRRRGRLLIAELAQRHRLLSFAIVGGGFVEADAVAWCAVRDDELRPPVDPRAFLAAQLAGEGLGGAVGLMTSAALDGYVDVTRAAGGLGVRCITTVGLDNALRAGDPAGGAPPQAGTINILCCASLPVSDEARVEMLSLVAEARTMAVLEGGVRSRQSGGAATGTGTDCIVVGAPCGLPALAYAGKHTELGHLVGAAVAEAVTRGVHAWLAAHGPVRAATGRS